MVVEPLTGNLVKSQDSALPQTTGYASQKPRSMSKFERVLENIFFHFLVIFLFVYVVCALSLLVSIIITISGGVLVKFLIFSFRIKRQKAAFEIVKVRKFLVPNDSLETILETMNQDLIFQVDNESEHFWVIKQE